MNFATVLRFVNMGRGDGWDERFAIPYFWKLMAEKYKVGMNYILTEYGFEEISEKCGYNDYKHFSVEFKKITGVSPSKYTYNFTD